MNEETETRSFDDLKPIVFTNDRLSQEEGWTEEQMREAAPVPMPTLTPQEFDELLRRNADPRAFRRSFRDLPSRIPSSDEGRVQGAPSPASNLGEVTRADVDRRPFWNGGKVFFDLLDGKRTHGSFAFVGNPNIILTAAHCVVTPDGAQYGNFDFRRAYHKGGGQKVGWRNIIFYPDYLGDPVNPAFDYAFVTTWDRSSAGWLGLDEGCPYDRFWSTGYPRDIENGMFMQKVEGEKGLVKGNIVEMKRNPMKKGCSGGPWIGDLTGDPGSGDYATGLNSFFVEEETDSIYGPLFDVNLIGLYEYAVGALAARV